ncbi:sensor histidine kinase [Planotetraspora sp. A-T 1434]|uniref:sensor histidine kinase n=1 Tax=Planotetraspora sp. A-T 1434 TaxID=2979219 RepID=UPI0021C1EAF2|nr:sensor histidine kinase [Planotetraspora sp. A-T 1434]MCT9930359.1 sensor histidine kinase [Planotetraspora sp. A-T 1434]
MNADRDHWMNPLGEGERGPDAKGMVVWVALTGGPVWDIAEGRSHPLWLAVPGACAAAVLYLVTIHLAFADRRRAKWRALPVLAAVVVADVVAFQGNWLYLLVMLSIAGGVTLRGRELPLLLFALCAAALAIRLTTGGALADSLSLVWGVFTAGIIPAIIIRLWEAIRELQRTREELAHAAVAEERLRFSRDLHDLLGHTLSVMVVKAEAVRRLAPRDAEAAARQATDIEQIGRQALTEVRAAVTGYRGRGLTAELESARTVLADAGIALTIRTPVVRLPPETDALLGWAVREGVTNVIRHSGAGTCEIDLCGTQSAGTESSGTELSGVGLDGVGLDGTGAGDLDLDGGAELVLQIRDNGRGGHADHAVPPNPQGNGLVGLRERVAAVGGTMDARALPGKGFLLRVAVPQEPCQRGERV